MCFIDLKKNTIRTQVVETQNRFNEQMENTQRTWKQKNKKK